jgi:inorganic pyrophosphatase
MNLDYVSIGRNPPEEVNAIIEVPIGGEPIKYEMDKKAGTLVVDRFLDTPIRREARARERHRHCSSA